MFLITGLGNPTQQYEDTPHNAGYMFLDRLREYLLNNSQLEVTDWKNEKKIFLSDICKVKKGGELIGILQKPLTFMNNSGNAVQLLLKKFPVEDYILAHDDLDIPLGSSKIHSGKAPKSHKGDLSVQEVLDDNDFLRVRLGVDNRWRRVIPGDEYVLLPYKKKELETLRGEINRAIDILIREHLEL